MSDTRVFTFDATMRGREVVFSNPEHELAFLPSTASKPTVGLRYDGTELRDQIVSFVTWDDDAVAELVLEAEAAALLGAGTIEITVTNDALEAFSAVCDLFETSEGYRELTDQDRAAYAESAVF